MPHLLAGGRARASSPFSSAAAGSPSHLLRLPGAHLTRRRQCGKSSPSPVRPVPPPWGGRTDSPHASCRHAGGAPTTPRRGGSLLRHLPSTPGLYMCVAMRAYSCACMRAGGTHARLDDCNLLFLPPSFLPRRLLGRRVSRLVAYTSSTPTTNQRNCSTLSRRQQLELRLPGAPQLRSGRRQQPHFQSTAARPHFRPSLRLGSYLGCGAWAFLCILSCLVW